MAGERILKKLCTKTAIERYFRAALTLEIIRLDTETASEGQKRAALFFSLFDFRCCWTQIGLRFPRQDVADKVLVVSVL